MAQDSERIIHNENNILNMDITFALILITFLNDKERSHYSRTYSIFEKH